MTGSLTRVCVWEDGHGWQPISAESVALQQTYRHRIESGTKTFLCELCDQYVSFVNTGNYRPHFKHPKGSNDCDEKITSSNSFFITNPLGFSLPIRISIADSNLEIFIGFLPIGESKLKQIENGRGQLTIHANGRAMRTFNIDSLRFMSDKISYLSVGSNISEKYKIDCGGKVDYIYWPTEVDGFHRNGTLFDKVSGKRLPRNASVEVGREYWLIRKSSHWHQHFPQDVTIKKEITLGEYEIYVVNANLLSRSAADFFMNFGARLTDAIAEIIQIYPFVLNSPHFTLHASEKVWFHKTDGYVDTCPGSEMRMPTLNVFNIKGDNEKMLLLSRFEGRTSVLRYIMLRKNSADFTKLVEKRKTPFVEVCDEDGVDFEARQYDRLPKKRRLHILPEFDGYIDVYSITENFVSERYELKNGNRITLEIVFDNKYRMFQGLDCVFEIVFVSESKLSAVSDEQHLASLKNLKGHRVAISHTFGCISSKVRDMPLTRLWIVKQIRQGFMYSDAKEYLRRL